ncbi:unnamed protein product [Chrysodeixis includens]|uniref:Uncharacterized protein n=1 Tax=Chrysodeixis includens TaxID=689277 RepID=A0A9P0BP48_CHRIL|nr:unnamed protein product [Chrysodeixis includens]
MFLCGPLHILLYFTGTVLSIVCTTVILMTWCLIPQWRTLQNYINLQQILCGTLYMCFFCFQPFSLVNLQELWHDDAYYDWDSELTFDFMRIMVIWSLCFSLVAYLRLVFDYNGKISNGKLKATTFVVYVFSIVTAIYRWLVSYLLNKKKYEHHLMWFVFYGIVSMSLIVFIRLILSVIFLSCCKKRVSRRNFGHMLTLVGVAVICDVTLAAQAIIMVDFSHSDNISCVVSFFYFFRLVYQSMLLLLEKSLMTQWKLFVEKLRNCQINSINPHIPLATSFLNIDLFE